MTTRERNPAPPDVTAFVDQLAQLCEHHLGSQLAGVFLIGSLAHGGYSERYSDIDVAVIMESLDRSHELDVVKERLVGASATLASRLSLFWTDVQFADGRFPLLDRIDYLDHGVALLQRRRAVPERPTREEIRAYLGGPPLQNWAQAAARFGALGELAAKDHKGYLRTLLYPARFICTWETGLVVSNDEAVAYIRKYGHLGADIDIVLRALSCRTRGADPSELFPERHGLGRLVRICSSISNDAGRSTTRPAES
jgi:predicted nucleotidyltransferase